MNVLKIMQARNFANPPAVPLPPSDNEEEEEDKQCKQCILQIFSFILSAAVMLCLLKCVCSAAAFVHESPSPEKLVGSLPRASVQGTSSHYASSYSQPPPPELLPIPSSLLSDGELSDDADKEMAAIDQASTRQSRPLFKPDGSLAMQSSDNAASSSGQPFCSSSVAKKPTAFALISELTKKHQNISDGDQVGVTLVLGAFWL